MDVIPSKEPSTEASDSYRGRRLRVLESSHVAMVLDVAVSRALRNELETYDQSRVEAIQRIVKREFSRLVKDNAKRVRGIPENEFRRELERSKKRIIAARERAQAEHTELLERSALLRERQVAEERQERVDVEDRARRLEDQLEDRFRLVLGDADPDGRLPRHVYERLVAESSELARSEWERSYRERNARTEREIELFERRIQKLTRSLDATEAALAELSELKEGKEGVASIYRTVQGFENESDNLVMKKAMLERIFETNKTLQKAAQ